MRKELKLLDSARGKIKNLDSFDKEWFESASNRRKGSYRSKHKTMISKTIRKQLKTQLEKTIPSLDEVREEDLLNKYTNLYSEMNEKQRN